MYPDGRADIDDYLHWGFKTRQKMEKEELYKYKEEGELRQQWLLPLLTTIPNHKFLNSTIPIIFLDFDIA